MAGKISLVLNILLIGAVIWLFMRIESVKQETRQKAMSAVSDSLDAAEDDTRPGSRMAYINIDTLDANYQYLQDKQKQLARERQRVEQRVQDKMAQAEQRYQQLMQRAQTMTREEAQAAQRELQNLQADVQEFQQRQYDELTKKEMSAQDALKKNLKAYLDSVNADNRYDFILSYGTGSGVLLADDSLEITQRVLRGLNQKYEREKATE